jgi:hydrogenase-4 component B
MIGTGLLILILALIPAFLRKSSWFTGMIWMSSVALITAYGQVLVSGLSKTYVLSLGIPSFQLILHCTQLAAWFGLVFGVGIPLGSLYGLAYLKAHPSPGMGSHLVSLVLLVLSMHLVLLAADMLVFMAAWELMALASFIAILCDRASSEARNGALYYLIMMQVGAAILLTGFGWLYSETGRISLIDVRIGNLAKWLIMVGFAFKAGFFPFYSWLPKAHPVAPSHLSGLMSGLMIKTGIFGIIWVFIHSVWQPVELYLLLAISLITAFNGVIHALAESNLKRALAFSSVENIGIIGIALCFWQMGLLFNNPGMATLGLLGALLHILFHSLFKPLLFYLSGNVMLATHSLKCDELGGLDKRMPYTAKLFLLGTASISALPVFCGFVSEFIIFGSIVVGFDRGSLAQSISSAIGGAGLAFVSALALIAFTKLYGIVFSGEPRSENAHRAKELPTLLLAGPAVLAGLCLIGGLFGWLPLLLLRNLPSDFGVDIPTLNTLISILQSIGILLLMLMISSGLVYWFKCRISRQSQGPTWACGYWGSSARMQYTASAYIDPIGYFLKPLLQRNRKMKSAQGYFPDRISYREEVKDYLDSSLIGKVTAGLRNLLALFSGIHNGRTNSYITWLLVGLVALLIWAIGVK